MPENHSISLPEPGTLRGGAGPFIHGAPALRSITLALIVAATIPLTAGTILFGWNTLRVAGICVAAALLVESAARHLAGRSPSRGDGQALLVGLLVACTMPPMVYWAVPLTAATVAILVGQIISGGVGNYLWQPVALSRVTAQFFFPHEFTRNRWPVLGPGYQVWGDLGAARPLPEYWSWAGHAPPEGAQAWLVARPVDLLTAPLPARPGATLAEEIAALVRDTLPPWPETLLGVSGGAIGEACIIALLVSGLLLAWRGVLRWTLAAGAVAGAVVSAAAFPVFVREGGRHLVAHGWPGLAVMDGLPVGLMYVLYQLTAGEFLLVVLLLAPDPTSSPLTCRGNVLFGATIGVLTMALRSLVGLPAAGYWALLIANALVPATNRLTRRHVFGT